MKLLISSLLVAVSLNAFAASTQMDDLIRGEMAAVKSYSTMLDDMKDGPERSKLEKIRADHENAVSKLKGFATQEVKEDTKTAGAWGTFASAWTSGAKVAGNKTALKALTQGEEHGIEEYKEALEDKTVKSELKQMIRTQFIPKQEEHLKTIKTMM
jgi:rubrerythrin